MELMKPLLAAVDAVLFDLDGTLVETNIDFPLMKQRMLALAAEQGVDAGALSGLDILAIVEAVSRSLIRRGRHDEAERAHAHAMGVLEEIELRHARSAREIPFARELVGEMNNRGIKTGIVTRNCRKASEISLDIVGIQPNILISREDALRHKPHPQPLQMALSALSAQPEASIMVGDHPMDIQSGQAAGLKTIAFLRDDRPHGFFDDVRPDFVACDLREVLHAIVDCDG
jgi:phosphoglycolate phosphatase